MNMRQKLVAKRSKHKTHNWQWKSFEWRWKNRRSISQNENLHSQDSQKLTEIRGVFFILFVRKVKRKSLVIQFYLCMTVNDDSIKYFQAFNIILNT